MISNDSNIPFSNNQTSDSSPGQANYKILLYVNGRYDFEVYLILYSALKIFFAFEKTKINNSLLFSILKLTYNDVVLSNDSPLSLFKDITHDGPTALIQDLNIW
jgi:hypothetical protein